MLLFAFAFFPETSHAQAYQATPVTVSTEKVRIGGKLYYSHKVLEKQTLYSISKAYGATIEDIIKANPSIGEKGEHLRAGTVLLIPAEPSEAQDRKTSSKTADTVKTAAQAPPGTPEKSNDTGDDDKDEEEKEGGEEEGKAKEGGDAPSVETPATTDPAGHATPPVAPAEDDLADWQFIHK